MRDFFVFRLQERLMEFRLDAYTIIESDRINYIQTHQKQLRADLYNNLSQAANEGNINPTSA
ncbi:hypothetical protein V2J09_011197 [Rumex salicifolius]